MRILVTGSRDWTHWNILNNALNDACRHATNIVIVHGACKTGADRMAKQWAEYQGVIQDPHPAKWKKYHKGAGPIRNAEMVALGADLCLAFIRNSSKGATGCADLSEKAGIETRRFTYP